MKIKRSQMILVALLLCSSLGISSSSASADTDRLVTLPRVGMQMKIPATWGKGPVSGESILASYSRGSKLYPNLNVSLEPAGGKGLQSFFKQLLNLLPSPQVNESKNIDINGIPAFYSDVTWTSLLGQLRALRMIVPVADKMLVITFIDKFANLSEQNAQEYRRSLHSLKKTSS